MSIVVTGGAGYIGSHVVRLLLDSAEVVVIDDLRSGNVNRVRGADLVRLDLCTASPEQLRSVLLSKHATAVIHLAALKQAGESVEQPARYFRENISSLGNLLSALDGTAVDRFVFSSSAAVYGNVSNDLVTEATPTRPINPYGETKLAGEWLLRSVRRARKIKAVSLRYFNVAGAGWPELGDEVPMNLVTRSIAALERGEVPKIFGDDYLTPDGTGVRDYVHVLDLARAHVAALAYLNNEPMHDVFNVGTGQGASVRDVLEALREASGVEFAPKIARRRTGDPAKVVADPTRVQNELSWSAEYDLDRMVRSAWQAHVHARKEGRSF